MDDRDLADAIALVAMALLLPAFLLAFIPALIVVGPLVGAAEVITWLERRGPVDSVPVDAP